MILHDALIDPIVRLALAEDIGRGDITASAVFLPTDGFSGKFVARGDGRVAGMACMRLAMKALGAGIEIMELVKDGDDVLPGEPLANVRGSAQTVLTAERVALNFLGRLSGIATLTRAYVRAVDGTGARIADTRKTTPGLRVLEKHAVFCGGGVNHRFGLDDAILIKDNHIAACGGDVRVAIARAKKNAGHLVKIEVEVDTLEQLASAIEMRPDVIMLDNFSLANLALAVQMIGDLPIVTEASGGVNLNTVRAIADTGVDVISVGALTHSAPNFDIGLDSY